ncbi:MAG: PQQ-binding-like beta-propeller repeat protein, partial [Planctomycetota bacterium]
LIRDSIEEIVDELRQLAKLYHINSIFSKEAKTLELITLFLPKDMEARVQLAETFEKIDPVYSAQLYLQLSQYHNEPGKIKSYLSKAASLDPNNPEVTRYMIHGLVRTGENELALQSGKEFFYSLVDSKQMEQAENLANYFIQAGVGVEEFHRLCIETYEKQGNFQRSIREYEVLIRYFRKSGNQKGEEDAHQKVVALEDKILSLSVRKETRKIGSARKSFPLMKFLILFSVLIIGGYGGLLYLQSQKNNLNTNGSSSEETEKLRQQAMKDVTKLITDLEDLQGKEFFESIPEKCKDLKQIIQILTPEDRTKYEIFAKKCEETAKKQEQLLQEDRDKLTKIDKQESASIEVLKDFIATTAFHRLKNEASTFCEILERRELEGQKEREKFLKMLEQQKYKDAHFAIQSLKRDSLLHSTKAIAQLKYFIVINIVPFNIKLKYGSQDFGKTPYIAYLNSPDSFNVDLIETEPGFSKLLSIKENPLNPKEEPWSQTFEVSRKELWTFRGEGSFLASAFINKTNNAVALGDTSGNFYLLLNGNEAYRFSIGKGLDKDIRVPCFALDEKYFFISANKTIYCVDPENSKNSGLIWQAKLNSIAEGLAHDDKSVYVFDSGKGLRAFSTKTGEETPIKPYPTGKSYTAPILVENEIFCAIEDKQRIFLLIYELERKKIKLEQDIGPNFAGTALTYGAIHIKADQKRIFLTNRSGKIISYFYSQKRTGSPIQFPNMILDPLFLEEEMVVACQDGYLYVYDYTPEKKWDMEIFKVDQQKFTCSPIVKGDYIFVATDDNHIYAIHRPSKTVVWSYATKEKVNALQVHGNWLIISGDKAKGDQLIALDLSGT